jgi:hypothetical protein
VRNCLNFIWKVCYGKKMFFRMSRFSWIKYWTSVVHTVISSYLYVYHQRKNKRSPITQQTSPMLNTMQYYILWMTIAGENTSYVLFGTLFFLSLALGDPN